MKTSPNARKGLPVFESGQVWEMPDSELHIGLVGKTLVHYKHYQGKVKRAPVSLANRGVLEKFLITRKAVLAQKVSTPSRATRQKSA